MQKISKQKRKKNYQQKYLRFKQSQYTSRMDRIILRVAQQCYTIKDKEKDMTFQGFPMYRLIKQIVQKILMNQFQLQMFATAIQNYKWNIHQKIFQKNWSNMKALISSPDVQSTKQFKRISFNLLLLGYITKIQLNQPIDNDILDIRTQIQNYISQCEETVKSWSYEYNKLVTKINPKQLKQISDNIKPNKHSSSNNYTTLAQSILHICPPYNADKSKKQDKSNQNHQPKSIRVSRKQSSQKEQQIPNQYYNTLSRRDSDQPSFIRMDSRIDDDALFMSRGNSAFGSENN